MPVNKRLYSVFSLGQHDCSRLGAAFVLLGALLMTVCQTVAAQGDSPWSAIGRAATADEIKAWDIDVRADFKGLPPGQGSAVEGIAIWEAKCESCHGVFAESAHVFAPLTGGTTAEDIERGRVANLQSGTSYPHRTTLMKLSTISTLWDYINRAMPWNAPKSLAPDEVYAVIAYLLYLGDVISEEFILSNENIAKVQQRLPNRNGMTKYQPMWQVDGKPDVQGDACMDNCKTELEVRSFLPDYARDAHGNLAQQHRIIGATRGAVTTEPKTKSLKETREIASRITVPGVQGAGTADNIAVGGAVKPDAVDPDAAALAKQSNCLACHDINNKVVGPAFSAIAKRYANEAGAIELLAQRVRDGTSGAWGPVPMPANAGLGDAASLRLIRWIMRLSEPAGVKR